MGKKRSKAWFAVERSRKPAALWWRSSNKAVLEMLLDCATHRELERVDLATLADEYARLTIGTVSARSFEDGFGFAARLHRDFGALKTYARRTGLVSLAHMAVLERVLRCFEDALPAHRLAELDALLVGQFTASVPNQIVPKPRALKTWLEELLRKWQIDDAAATEEDEPEPPVVQLLPSKAGRTVLLAELADLDAHAVMEHLEAHAKNHDGGTGAALVSLVCQTSEAMRTVKKTVLYGIGKPVEGTQMQASWLYGIGPVAPSQQKLLATRPMEYVDATDIAQRCCATYLPDPHVKRVVRLRDRTCRYPGCDVPAHRCDIDHVINFNDGGWTTVSNLQCLCRKHHNHKTDRRVVAIMTRHGHVTWHTAGGTLLGTTIPTGPLAGLAGIERGITTRHSGHTTDRELCPPSNNGLGRWGYTLKQKNLRYRKRYQERVKHAEPTRPPDPPPDF